MREPVVADEMSSLLRTIAAHVCDDTAAAIVLSVSPDYGSKPIVTSRSHDQPVPVEPSRRRSVRLR